MSTLFERSSFGNMKLRNRVFMSPMGTGADPDGGFSEQSREYYEERSAGGFGLIISGFTGCSQKYEELVCNVLDRLPMVERLQRVVESCHNYGAKFFLQLSPGSGRMSYYDGTRPPYAPSAVPSIHNPDQLCKPFSIEQIQDIEELFGNSALWAKNAGCDGICIHGYGGYLIDQFMCSKWNKREDEYGGSLENRMRFAVNLIKQIKSKCGDDFPILFKFTLDHLLEGGRTVEEGLKVAKILEEAGVTGLHVDLGCFETWNKAIPTVYDEPAVKLEYAAMVKEIVDIPVSCDGKFDDPEIAEQAVKSGKVDYIGLGKQAIADPEWPNKAKAGRNEDIRYCIGCNDCLLGIFKGRVVQCSINPTVGFENFTKLKPMKADQDEDTKILIIGAGIGGMKTAITAARRGYSVTVWEKEDKTGGLGNAAAAPYMKTSVKNYVRYLDNQVKKYADKITMVYNKEATLDDVKSFDPDKIVVATGASAVIPPIPGMKGNPKVSTAVDYLGGRLVVDGNVLVIGAGLVGCETALDLANKGNKVTVIEMLDRIIPKDEVNLNVLFKLNEMISEAGLNMMFNTKMKAVEADKVVLENDGSESSLPYDYILVAAGMRSNDTLANELHNHFDDVYVIGDADKPGKIMEAVHQGYSVANNMF